jgi:uncharacterized damage-inducible protein DinB
MRNSVPVPPDRPHTPSDADEKTMLSAFLDQQRWDVVNQVAGLSEEDQRRSLVASGWSLLGLVKHLTEVERWWFQDRLAERDLDYPWTDADPDADFRIEPGETTDQVLARYLEAVEESRRIVAATSLDTVAPRAQRGQTLRWILVHMIEETARHNGHGDVVREQIDGRIGPA